MDKFEIASGQAEFWFSDVLYYIEMVNVLDEKYAIEVSCKRCDRFEVEMQLLKKSSVFKLNKTYSAFKDLLSEHSKTHNEWE